MEAGKRPWQVIPRGPQPPAKDRICAVRHAPGRNARFPAPEELEIIRIIEQSYLPAKQTLDQLGIARRTFYRWYDRYVDGGPEALADRP